MRVLNVDRVTFCNHVNTNSATTSCEQQPPSAPAAVGGTTPTQPLPAQGQQQPVSGAGSGSSSPQPAPSPALSKVPETSAVSINDVSKSKSPSESQPAPASPPQSQPQPSQNANPAAALAQPSALPAEGKQTKTSKHSCAYVPSGPTQLGPDNITLVQAIQYTRRTPPFTVQSGDVLRLLKTAQTLPVAAVGYLFGAKGKQCRVGVALVDQDGRPFIRWDPAANVDVCLGVADVTAARLIDTAWKAKMKEFKASSQETKGNGVELRPRNGLGHALTDLGGSSSSAATPTAGKSKGSGKSKGKGKETQPANQPTDEGAGPVLDAAGLAKIVTDQVITALLAKTRPAKRQRCTPDLPRADSEVDDVGGVCEGKQGHHSAKRCRTHKVEDDSLRDFVMKQIDDMEDEVEHERQQADDEILRERRRHADRRRMRKEAALLACCHSEVLC